MKWRLPSQTLVHNSADAPQVGLGVIVLGHDDLRSLRADKQLAGQAHGDNKPSRHRVNTLTLTMYMGEPHSVAAIVFVCRWRANPKSAAGGETQLDVLHVQSRHSLPGGESPYRS